MTYSRWLPARGWRALVVAVLTLAVLGVLTGTRVSAGGVVRTPRTAASSAWTIAEFNDPLRTGSSTETSQLRALISGAPAGALVQLAAFKLTDMVVLRGLLDALLRGVHVEVVLNGSGAGSGCLSPGRVCSSETFGMLTVLNKANRADPLTWFRTCDGIGPTRSIPLRRAGPGCIGQGLNHNKFALASQTTVADQVTQDAVLISSANGTDSRHAYNNALQINEQPQLYAAYEGYFDELAATAGLAAPGTTTVFTAADGHDRISRTVAANDLETWTFPRASNDDPVAHVLGRVRTANDCRNDTGALPGPRHTTVEVAMYDIAGRPQLLDQLAALRRDGCSVTIVYTKITAGAKRFLQHNHIAPYRLCDPMENDRSKTITTYVHSKYFLVNGSQRGLGRNRRATYTGSENWTNRALVDADNQMLQFVEPARTAPIFGAYQANFMRLLALSKQSPQQPSCSAHD